MAECLEMATSRHVNQERDGKWHILVVPIFVDGGMERASHHSHAQARCSERHDPLQWDGLSDPSEAPNRRHPWRARRCRGRTEQILLLGLIIGETAPLESPISWSELVSEHRETEGKKRPRAGKGDPLFLCRPSGKFRDASTLVVHRRIMMPRDTFKYSVGLGTTTPQQINKTKYGRRSQICSSSKSKKNIP